MYVISNLEMQNLRKNDLLVKRLFKSGFFYESLEKPTILVLKFSLQVYPMVGGLERKFKNQTDSMLLAHV